MKLRGQALVLLVSVSLSLGGPVAARQMGQQPGEAKPGSAVEAPPARLLVPQIGGLRPHGRAPTVAVRSVVAETEIVGKVATTTLTVLVAAIDADAVVELGVPVGRAARDCAATLDGRSVGAQYLNIGAALEVLESAAAEAGSPRQLEFAGYGLVRTGPIDLRARSERTVRVSWRERLASVGDRVDFVLPLSIAPDPETKWALSTRIKAEGRIAAVYSPTHTVTTTLAGPSDAVVAVGAPNAANLPLGLSYLTGTGGPAATFYAYPGSGPQGGHFMMLVALVDDVESQGTDGAGDGGKKSGKGKKGDGARPARDVTFVVDRSGSMAGTKLDEARRAVSDTLAGLPPGATFNVLDFSDTVCRFSEKAVAKGPDGDAGVQRYLDALAPVGGTNIHGALVAAVSAPPPPGAESAIVFLTDGEPTVGVTDPVQIVRDVAAANVYKRRIVAFGVGPSVNESFLRALAEASGGTVTMIAEGERIDAVMPKAYHRLSDRKFENVVASRVGEGAVAELYPARLGHLYVGDVATIVGTFKGGSPVAVRLAGTYGTPREFHFTFDPALLKRRDGFVRRIWAERRIEALFAEASANAAGASPATGREAVVAEIVRLAVRYGVQLGSPAKPYGTLSRPELEKHLRALLWANTAKGASQGPATLVRAAPRLSALSVGPPAARLVQDLTFYVDRGWWLDSRAVGPDEIATIDAEMAFGTAGFRTYIRALAKGRRAGVCALGRDVVLPIDGSMVRLRMSPSR